MNFGRYEFNDSTVGSKGSHKFWTCEDNGDGTCTITYGRIGGKANSGGVKSTSDGMKKIREKLGKGYQYVGDGEVIAMPEKKTKKNSNGLTEFQEMMKELAK